MKEWIPSELRVLLLSCVAVVAATIVVARTWADVIAAQARQASVDQNLLRKINAWNTGETRRVVLVGDSLAICRGSRRDRRQTVAGQLSMALKAADRSSTVLDLAHPGLRPVDHLALVNEALARGVNVVVVEVNLRLLRPATKTARLPQLARKLTWKQAFAVREELAESGISLVDIAIIRFKERLGLLYVLEGAREWAQILLEDLALEIGRHLSLEVRRFPRYAVPAHPFETYRAHFAEYSAAKTLHVLREHVWAAGGRPLFYVAPVSPQNLEAAGVDREEFAIRVDALRRSVGANSEEWLDLHSLVAAGVFRDRGNHMRPTGCSRVGLAVADRVAHLLES